MASEKVDVDFTVKTARGATTFKLAIGTAPARLAALVPVCQRITEVVVGEAIEHEQNAQRELSCKAGCGACCRQLVPVSAPEAFFLADYVISLPEEERDAVLARFERAAQDLDAAGLRVAMETLMADADSPIFEDASIRYFEAGVSCPFLVEESCGVHAQRPIICRDYNVTSPAELCAKPRLHQIRRVPTPPTMSPPLARVAAKLLGTRPALIPITMAMEWAEANVAHARKTWPANELFQALTLELGGEMAPR